MAIQSSRPQGSVLALIPDEDEEQGISEQIDLEEGREEEPEHPTSEDPHAQLVAWIEDHNIARHLDQNLLDQIGMLVVREYEIDENSRAEWLNETKKAMKFATQEAEPKQFPWPKASNIIFPLITSAAIEFNARTYPAIVQGRKIVKGVVWGSDDGTPATQDGKQGGAPVIGQDGQPQWLVQPGAKRLRADRIGEHMSWQLIDEMDYWEDQTDSMLFQLPIVGGAARKTYRDPSEDSNESELVNLENLVWNKNAKSFERAPRHTELIDLYPHEILDLENADETFLPIIYGVGGDAPTEGEEGQPADMGDSSAPHQFLEQHRRYDLDGDGYPEPLIVTVHKQSAKVVRIVARYEEDGIKVKKDGSIRRVEAVQHYTLYKFLPDPKGGSYPVGFGHLLKPLNEGVNTALNQMFDAGSLQNTGGGFYGTGLSMPAGALNFSLGEYKPVNTKGGNIRDSIFPMPFQGPNPVLFQLLGFLVEEAKGLASTQNILAGDAATLAKAAPTTMLALIEQGMQVYTAIHKRVYRALKGELNNLYRLNRLYLDKDTPYKVGDSWRVVEPSDYRLGGGVEPVADPTMVTDMQRLGRAAVLQQFSNDPLMDQIEIRRRYLEAASIENIDRLFVKNPQPPPDVQMEMQTTQAQLGNIRSQEQKNMAQAVLFMSQARAHATGPQVEWFEQQLQLMRLRIEALNTTVKAAAVDAQVHGHNTRLEGVKHKAKEVASGEPGEPEEPTPASAFGTGRFGGPNAGGLGSVAAPPGNSALLPLAGGQPGGAQGGGAGEMAGGEPTAGG